MVHERESDKEGNLGLQCSCNAGANVSFIGSNWSSEPEIGYLWDEVFAEKNGAGFYVSMDYSHPRAPVEMREPLGCPEYDAESLLPI